MMRYGMNVAIVNVMIFISSVEIFVVFVDVIGVFGGVVVLMLFNVLIFIASVSAMAILENTSALRSSRSLRIVFCNVGYIDVVYVSGVSAIIR